MAEYTPCGTDAYTASLLRSLAQTPINTPDTSVLYLPNEKCEPHAADTNLTLVFTQNVANAATHEQCYPFFTKHSTNI